MERVRFIRHLEEVVVERGEPHPAEAPRLGPDPLGTRFAMLREPEPHT